MAFGEAQKNNASGGVLGLRILQFQENFERDIPDSSKLDFFGVDFFSSFEHKFRINIIYPPTELQANSMKVERM